MDITVIISKDSTSAERAQREQEIATVCADAGYAVLLVPHLYHLPEEHALWGELAALPGTLIVLSWLHPRPMEWLLRRHGVTQKKLAVFAMGTVSDALECCSAINVSLGAPPPPAPPPLASSQERGELPNIPAPLLNKGGGVDIGSPLSREARTREGSGVGVLSLDWQIKQNRWYPVIDASRCVNCGHCENFCLFGVYEVDDDGQVQVVNPDYCKAGCPACSRICPQGAIIFPLYEKDPAVAGAPGLLMQPDLAARKMYYRRTQIRCPVCGGMYLHSTPRDITGVGCQECGLPIAQPVEAAPPDEEDDIDLLISELDELARRKA